jgi:hypothetical protein
VVVERAKMNMVYVKLVKTDNHSTRSLFSHLSVSMISHKSFCDIWS